MPHIHAIPAAGPADREAAARLRRRLALVLALTAGYTLAEVGGGWLARSLALLADAGHMLTDVMALGLALLASRLSERPPDASRTYGYRRVEILAALFNGTSLIVIALLIFREAAERLRAPLEVDFGLMAAVAAGGLLVNLAGAFILHGARGGLNLRGAYLHVLGDLLGSVATLAAAGAIGLGGWNWVDPLLSATVGVVIIWGAVRLVLDAVNVLMEGAPAHLDATEVQQALADVDGVAGVHDLHLWSLGGDTPLLSAHVVLDHSRSASDVLRAATEILRVRFGIDHATVQVEPADFNIVLRAPRAGAGGGD